MNDTFEDFVAALEPQYRNSASYMFTFNARAHGGATLEQAHAAAVAAHEASVWGADCKKDSRGNYIQQGIGAPGRETGNHYASILRYCGPVAYEKAVREIYRRDPDRARKLNLPEPQRVGA